MAKRKPAVRKTAEAPAQLTQLPEIKIPELPGVENRPYQNRTVTKTLQHFLQGTPSVLIEAPTGSGKSIMAFQCIKFWTDMGLTVTWSTMRRNLLRQSGGQLEDFGLKVNVVSMFAEDVPHTDILIFDEGHHLGSVTGMHLLSQVKPKFLLIMSATPLRTDKIRLPVAATVRDASIYALMREGYLSNYDHWIAEKADPVTYARMYMADREKWGKTVAFFHTEIACRKFAVELEANGIECPVVMGNENFKANIKRFEEHCDVATSVNVMLEGYDYPPLRTVFLRDASRTPSIQMAGRALRLWDGKEKANIVQSDGTKWNISRSSRPLQSHVWKNDAWARVGDDTKVTEAVQTTITRLSAADAPTMPKFILERQKKKRGIRADALGNDMRDARRV